MQNSELFKLERTLKAELAELSGRVGSLEQRADGTQSWSGDVNREIAELKQMLTTVLERLPPAESKA